jgi:DNA (cytosine-5)-methyltransferase 1
MKNFAMADLFCGAGGTSSGAVAAVRGAGFTPRLTAVNHWAVAVATHAVNHPEARHLQTSVDDVDPRKLFEPGELRLLWASPECTHHSIARGGKPMSDQSRSTAWCVVRWADALLPPVILVENVPEFATWGPIDKKGRPIESRKGEVFRAWLGALESLGYRTDYRLLCAADYGDPTTRRRLFVQAVRGGQIRWPEPTHSSAADLFGTVPWRAAREVIDWDLPSQSIYDRAKPLSPKTMRRIYSGLKKFAGACLVNTANIGFDDAPSRSAGLMEPMPTVTGSPRFALAEPFIVELRGTSDDAIANSGRSVSRPLSTVTAAGTHHGLIQPALLPQQSDGALRPISKPCPTVATAGAIGLVEPFLVSYYGTAGASSVDDPLDTVTTKHRHALVRPIVTIEGQRYQLDIRFRMLQPHELAAAQGFPSDYQFTGTKTQQIKQIGNAVPCGVARALVAAVMPNFK